MLYFLFIQLATDNSIYVSFSRFVVVVVACVQRVCKLRGWAKDTPKNKETYDVMMEIWTGLRSKADKDNDGQVRLSSCGCPSVCLCSSMCVYL